MNFLTSLTSEYIIQGWRRSLEPPIFSVALPNKYHNNMNKTKNNDLDLPFKNIQVTNMRNKNKLFYFE